MNDRKRTTDDCRRADCRLSKFVIAFARGLKF